MRLHRERLALKVQVDALAAETTRGRGKKPDMSLRIRTALAVGPFFHLRLWLWQVGCKVGCAVKPHRLGWSVCVRIGASNAYLAWSESAGGPGGDGRPFGGSGPRNSYSFSMIAVSSGPLRKGAIQRKR